MNVIPLLLCLDLFQVSPIGPRDMPSNSLDGGMLGAIFNASSVHCRASLHSLTMYSTFLLHAKHQYC